MFLREQIDDGNPVVKEHSLLKGCLHWWLPLPHNSGGQQIYDVVGGNHATCGTNTIWGESQIPGAKGVVHKSGTSGATFSAVALTEYTLVLYGATSRQTSGHYGLGGPTGKPTFGWNTESQLILIPVDGASAQVVSLSKKTGQWGQCAATWVSGNKPIGYSDNKAPVTYGSARTGTATWSYLGWFYNGSYWGGTLSSTMIYNRALSASELYKLYWEQWNGYPTMLRRYTRRHFLLAGGGGGGGGFQPAWASGSNVILGAGS